MAGQTSGQPEAVPEPHHSKRTSWAAVFIMIIGFIVGGLGLILGNWWLFWGGAAIVLVGAVFGLANGILQDVH